MPLALPVVDGGVLLLLLDGGDAQGLFAVVPGAAPPSPPSKTEKSRPPAAFEGVPDDGKAMGSKGTEEWEIRNHDKPLSNEMEGVLGTLSAAESLDHKVTNHEGGVWVYVAVGATGHQSHDTLHILFNTKRHNRPSSLTTGKAGTVQHDLQFSLPV